MPDMPELAPYALVGLLAKPELRIRTGILEIPACCLGKETDLAVHLGVGCRDLREWKVGRTPSDRKFVGLRWESLVQDIAAVLSDSTVPGYCVWVASVDIFLAGLPFRDRERFWGFMRNTFRQSRGLVLSMPLGALNLLPEAERKLWMEFGRLSPWRDLPF